MFAKVLAVLEEEKGGETLNLIFLADWIVNSTVDLGDLGISLRSCKLVPLRYTFSQLIGRINLQSAPTSCNGRTMAHRT